MELCLWSAVAAGDVVMMIEYRVKDIIRMLMDDQLETSTFAMILTIRGRDEEKGK